MPLYNKLLAGLALATVFSAPAFADGTPGQRVNRGPAPLEAHQPTSPEPGCHLIEDGTAWSCPARPVQRAPVIHKQTMAKPCCGKVTRTVVKDHPTVVTKRSVTHRTAQPRSTVTRRPVQAPSGIQLDMASFSGGVGAGVDGGFYGGGGTVIAGSSSSSRVHSHSASRFTFRSGHRGGKKRRHGGAGGCGC